ncbi:MAG: hypothetical protein AB7O48_06700 [Cyclobacteriaceae bacterium]
MKTGKLSKMKGGWFIGDFEPTLLRTPGLEVAVKRYNAGDQERPHFHKIATEYTLIVEGEVEMFGERYNQDDIIVVEPEDVTGFVAITNATTVVVKIPSVAGDKFIL